MAAAGGRQTLRSSSAVGMKVVSSRQRLVEDRQAGISDLRKEWPFWMVGLASHNATPSFFAFPRVPCTLRRARRGFGWRAARLGGSHLSAQSARRSATGLQAIAPARRRAAAAGAGEGSARKLTKLRKTRLRGHVRSSGRGAKGRASAECALNQRPFGGLRERVQTEQVQQFRSGGGPNPLFSRGDFGV